MDNGKEVGHDNIPIDAWTCLGKNDISQLTKLFNKVMRSKKMPNEWTRSTLVPIYKKKRTCRILLQSN